MTIKCTKAYAGQNSDNVVYLHTNYQERDLLAYYELTDRERKEVDYITNEQSADIAYEQRFFRYLGSIYDTNDGYERTDKFPLSASFAFLAQQWHGIQTDSAFSATVIKYADDDYNRIIVGRIHW